MATIDDTALDWVARQAAGGLSDGDRAAFDAWYAADIRHKGAYLRARAVNNALSRVGTPAALRPSRAEIEAELAPAPAAEPPAADPPAVERPMAMPSRFYQRRAFLGYGVAAAGAGAAVLAGTMLLPAAGSKQVLATAKGELRKVALADQSVATINGASTLEVRITDQLRQVALRQGEAWFAVAKDKHRPFIVAAGDVQARAVGTAFGVRRYDGGAEVLVSEGVVEVWSNEGAAPARVLTAGERAFVADRAASIAVQRQPREIERRLAWRDGNLVFVNQKLSEAVADFNRYSGKRIVIADPALGEKTFVGKYPIAGAERFAKDVSAYLAVPLRITAETIVIGRAPRST